jgi:hypothetical protein
VCSSSEAREQTGGNSRRTQSILESITTSQLPQIISRKRLPGTETIVTKQLSPDEARSISVCYVDDEPMHAAASAKTGYTDVPAGVWYETALQSFLNLGILDATQTTFRGSDTAVRAEFAKILGKIKGSVPESVTGPMHFDDVKRESWYAPFIEFAGTKGWMRGYANCIGTHPCTVKPGSTITRAEAAAMIVRFYDLKPLHLAPSFGDVGTDAWYASDIAVAADRCVIQGTGESRLANPNARMTRAEMVVLLYRARQNLFYGTDCTSVAQASSMTQSTSSTGNAAAISIPPKTPIPSSSVAPTASASSSSAEASSAQSSRASVPMTISSSSSSSASLASSQESTHPAAPIEAKAQGTPLAAITMILMGFLTLAIASRFFISAEASGL